MCIKKFIDFSSINEDMDVKPKKFMCYWNPKDFELVNEGSDLKMCAMEFFSDDNGYNEIDIKEIDALELSDTWISADYGFSHIITRVN